MIPYTAMQYKNFKTQKWGKRLAALLAVVLAVVLCLLPAMADFGEIGGNDDFGGDDYGGDWGGDDYDGDFYYVDTDGGESGNISTVAVIVVIIIIIVIKNKQAGKTGTPQKGAEKTDISTLNPMSSYTERDAAFDESALREKLSNLYVQMQNAWEKKNLESLRPYFTDALYAQYDSQLESGYRQKHQTNHIDRIAVLDVTLNGWTVRGENDCIIAALQTRVVDYVTDDATGNIVRGSDTAEKFMTYEWTLSRKTGLVTEKETDGVHTVVCPHCGASVDINKSAKCEYCDSVLTVEGCDWVITDIKGIAQRTGN